MSLGLNTAMERRRSVREYALQPISEAALKRLIWAAQGVTDEDGRRTVPSAHGLNPLKLGLVVGQVDGLAAGLYDYDAETGVIRQVGTSDMRAQLAEAAIGDQPWVANAALIIAICADMIAPMKAFADQPPYGARGARYACIEAGAAAQNIQLSCVDQGLGSVLVAGFDDDATARVLGLEYPYMPLALLCIGVPLDRDAYQS